MPRNSSSSHNTFLDTIATRFDGIHSNFVLGNAQAHGWPIVYCSDGFCELTGFSRANVMAKGSGCKFLYGPESAEEERAKILGALEEKVELKTELQLYRKNGSPFWCLLDIVPIKNEKRDVVLFLVSHKDITKERSNNGTKDHAPGDPDSPLKGSGSDDSSDDNEDKKDGLPENYDYGRRRSRAVLYHISGQLNKQNKTKSKLQQLNRLASQMPEYKVQEVRKSRFIIVHYGIFKIGWDWLILLCTFYIAFMVPFNAAFRKSARLKDFVYVDAAVEVLFAIDIVLNFRTTYLNRSGQVVYESHLIAVNYIRGWFLLDLLAAVPFDLLYAFSVETATMVHLLKVARLLRLARLLQKLERYNQYSILVLGLLLCMFALLAHWLACIWYAIGKAELDEGDANWTVGWLYELSERLDNVIVNKTNIPDMMTSYITALYFTCSSLTSVGFGNVSANTNGEKIFSVCAMLLGAIMHAVVFGNVTTIIQRMYARKAIFHSKSKDLKDFFRIHHFPKELKHRMRDYFQAMWSINNGIDFKEIVKDFPEDMRGEIGLHLHREILSLPLFQTAPPGCLKSVSLRTERFVCGPGEFIMRKGDAVNYLYYVCSGSLEVLKDDQVVAILGKGDIFGTDLDYDDPVSVSGCDVRTLAYCELLCIQVKGLVDALLLYPDYADTFNTELPNDLTYNVREGHEDHSDDESSSAAPIVTLPSISEDEEENDARNNEVDVISKTRSKQDDFDDDVGDGKSSTPMSPLLSHLGRDNSQGQGIDWLSARGRLPNGHIGSTLSTQLARHQIKLKRWIAKAKATRREDGHLMAPVTPTISSMPTTPTQSTGHTSSRQKAGSASLASLAMRRAVPAGPRVMQRRCREKLKTCRTLPTLTSVSSERSVEQVMVHTLQMELEGTRDSVIGLERRLDELHDDLSSISRNVDSLLRLVSQSPCPSNMYLSSHSLQPSYNPSPSPNPTMYPTPSFYFSQSTDNDTRDSISLQSTSSPAPEPWPGYGLHHRNDQFLSPFHNSRTGYGTPSPLASPRVNFSQSPGSGYFPSFGRHGCLNSGLISGLSNDRATTPDPNSDRSGRAPAQDPIGDRCGPTNVPHSPVHSNINKRTPAHTAQATLPQSPLHLCNPPGSTNKGFHGSTSSLIRAGRSPRPSNLSPLEPRRAKSVFTKPVRSLPGSAQAHDGDMMVSATAASSSLVISPSCSDQTNVYPAALNSQSLAFKSDYYHLAQLEPCSAGLGHCVKADSLRQSYIELSLLSSPHLGPDHDRPESPFCEPVRTNEKQTTLRTNETNTSRDLGGDSPLAPKLVGSPPDIESSQTITSSILELGLGRTRHQPQRSSDHSSETSPTELPHTRSPTELPHTRSPTELPHTRSPTKLPHTRSPTELPHTRSPTQKSSLKTLSSKSSVLKSPQCRHTTRLLTSPLCPSASRPRRPQSLSPSLKKVLNKSQMVSPEELEFIDGDPSPDKLLLCPTRNYSPSLSQLPLLSPSSSRCAKRARSSSTSEMSQKVETLPSPPTGGGAGSADSRRAPLSKVESL